MKAIINANIVLENGILWNGVIFTEGDKILSVGRKRETNIPENAEIIDANGAYVGPGFVDIHVHAGGKFSTSFEPVEAANYLLSHGETTILASPGYTFDMETLTAAIKCIRESMQKTKVIKGMYIEGPYTNPDYGACASTNPWRHGIVKEEFMRFVDEAGRDAKVWTIAPELENILPFVEYARKVNPDTIFSVGHSKATPAQIRKLGRFRPTIMTHTMNATGQTGGCGGIRGYGPDEYCFKEPDMYAELISDSYGIHVNSELQQLLIHTKGINRVILVTDSTTFDGAVPPEYAHIKDLNFDSQGGLAGSKLTMDMACRNIMTHTNCGIAQAFLMASTNPAKAIGMYDEIGSIEEGKIADLVFVDDKFNVLQVMSNGEIQNFE